MRSIEKMKPRAPSLSTAARAERRRAILEAKMEKLYGKDWRNKDKPRVDRILESVLSNRTKHTESFRCVFKKTETINSYVGSIHEPIDWDNIAKVEQNIALSRLN